MAELSSSKIKSFNLTLCNGEAVVRNQNRINGLIGVRLNEIPAQYHGLLAKAGFTGSVVNETIVWSTDVFKSTPRRLSELETADKARYKGILDNALEAYATAIAPADDNVKKLLYAAITYPSDNAVYCADDRVVITEWGMTPVGETGIIGMPYSIDDKQPVKNAGNRNDGNEGQTDSDSGNTSGDNDSTLTDGYGSDTNGGNTLVTADDDDTRPVTGNGGSTSGSVTDNGDTNAGSGISGTGSGHNGGNAGGSGGITPPPPPPGSPWWKKWWLWLLALLLLGLLLLLLLRSCGGESPIAPVTPEMGKEDVVLSEDSLRYVASNRILLLLTDKNADLDRFASDFKKKYPDSKKYTLSNPDTIVRRITLTLPDDERVTMSERLPDEFTEYGLIVIPESMYKNNVITNDPALQEPDKRWYFDECAVFDAWDVTKGSDEVVVAVIDDGFDLLHPELQGKIVKPFNAVTHDSNIFPSASGHGTHVAATAVGTANNSTGIAGIAPGCKLMPIQVGDRNGNMSMSAILDGVIYAIQNGADVVNMSLGMSFGPFVQFVPQYIQKNLRANMFLEEQRVWDYLFDIARQNNVTFVLAGGNENVLIGLDPMQRSSNTIKVSATQPDRYKASFSNYGDMSTVSAPGVRIFNAIPGGKYTFMDGTSMASPIVAGGCALLKSNDPSLSVTELAQILRKTGNPSGSDVGPIVNFAKALGAEYCESEDECSQINKRYNDLLAELEQLKRDHPGCIQTPDTLSLPEHFTASDLTGRWKSTTTLKNDQDQEVVLYFTFNGSPSGLLEIVEPNGDTFSAPLSVAIANDIVNIDQLREATNPAGKAYNPYRFTLKPDRDRKAAGRAKNKIETPNIFDFNLIRI